MNYLKEVYAQKNNPRVIAILGLAVLVFALSMVDAFSGMDHHHGDDHRASVMR
jgi:hypothetical protein